MAQDGLQHILEASNKKNSHPLPTKPNAVQCNGGGEKKIEKEKRLPLKKLVHKIALKRILLIASKGSSPLTSSVSHRKSIVPNWPRGVQANKICLSLDSR